MKALWLAPLFLSPIPEPPAATNPPPCFYEQFQTPDTVVPGNHHGLKRFNKDMT